MTASHLSPKLGSPTRPSSLSLNRLGATYKAATLNEAAFTDRLIRYLVEHFPVRKTGTEAELGAQRAVASLAGELGLKHRFEQFRFNDNLYATMALHFGLGTLGTAVSPLVPGLGALLHLLAGGSYWLDATRKAYLLRSLQPQRESQNLIITVPAVDDDGQRLHKPTLRVVVPVHIDAAFTGKIFEPSMVGRVPHGKGGILGRLLGRPLATATYSQLALVPFDLLRLAFGPLTWPLLPLEWLLSLPGALAFLGNLDVVMKNQTVPGANDNLSGVVAGLLLARRLATSPVPGLELVLVVTGAEEAGTGGAYHLAHTKRRVWDPSDTVILGLDTLSNGELRYIVEGEVTRLSVPVWLRFLLESLRTSDSRFLGVTAFNIPAGATDVLPFRVLGYDGVCLSCIDPSLGAPRHYHLPSDTPDNMDPAQIPVAVDFAEQLVHRMMEERAR